eukprot:TRINITY_DN6431_c0_g3_i1.p1 TRINITY_DN6431_c0_g3~~TRINITY_DN6431_c0_g3_i1.p1  ORF type:complete len:143 (+),score=13.69 TRINITY_DN6431_c0_g3_i1:64-492(+)
MCIRDRGGFFALVGIQNCIKDIPKKYFYPLETEVVNGDKPSGTSFQNLDNPAYAPDYAFYRWLSVEFGVTPVPLGTFYDNSQAKSVKDWKTTNFVRFAICKSDETFAEVNKRLNRKQINILRTDHLDLHCIKSKLLYLFLRK